MENYWHAWPKKLDDFCDQIISDCFELDENSQLTQKFRIISRLFVLGHHGQWFVPGSHMAVITCVLIIVIIIRNGLENMKKCRASNYPVISVYKSQHEAVSFKWGERGVPHTGWACANQRTFLNIVFFCDLHKTSPKRSMFSISVIPILVRISEYAYIFCSVKIKVTQELLVSPSIPQLTVMCTLTAC